MRADMKTSSNTRDCAFERYRIATSRRAPPWFIQSRMRFMTNSASSRSLNAAYSLMRSPSVPAVHRFLPSRPVLLRDQRVRRLEDVAGGAVVLLQAEHLRGRVIPREAREILDARAAPAVDGLVVVADDERRAVLARHQQRPGVLDGVRVLELVDEHVAEALLVVLAGSAGSSRHSS